MASARTHGMNQKKLENITFKKTRLLSYNRKLYYFPSSLDEIDSDFGLERERKLFNIGAYDIREIIKGSLQRRISWWEITSVGRHNFSFNSQGSFAQ